MSQWEQRECSKEQQGRQQYRIKSANAAVKSGAGTDSRRSSHLGGSCCRLWLPIICVLEAAALLKLQHV
jgi:hypothetical protein